MNCKSICYILKTKVKFYIKFLKDKNSDFARIGQQFNLIKTLDRLKLIVFAFNAIRIFFYFQQKDFFPSSNILTENKIIQRIEDRPGAITVCLKLKNGKIYFEKVFNMGLIKEGDCSSLEDLKQVYELLSKYKIRHSYENFKFEENSKTNIMYRI